MSSALATVVLVHFLLIRKREPDRSSLLAVDPAAML
jgi:hypothetical protein